MILKVSKYFMFNNIYFERMNFTMFDSIDYALVFQKAKEFALSYSNEIYVDTSHKETIFNNGIHYPCVPLRFPAKGNQELLENIMNSGVCSRMDGRCIDGRRWIGVLLWLEPRTYKYHKIR